MSKVGFTSFTGVGAITSGSSAGSSVGSSAGSSGAEMRGEMETEERTVVKNTENHLQEAS